MRPTSELPGESSNTIFIRLRHFIFIPIPCQFAHTDFSQYFSNSYQILHHNRTGHAGIRCLEQLAALHAEARDRCFPARRVLGYVLEGLMLWRDAFPTHPTSSRIAESFCDTMHDSFVDIKMEHHYGLHHEEDFGAGHHMVEVAEDHSPHHSPPHDYGDYAFSASTPVQLQSIYSRPMEPSYSSPQPLHPIITMPLWPSQITNPSENSPPPVAPLHRPILPMSKTTPAPILSPAPASSKSSHHTSTSRRTLTDSDRRRMCEYHNENPNVKQTEIGGELEKYTIRK